MIIVLNVILLAKLIFFSFSLYLIQATFFITYVLTSGWASLSSEIVQLFPLAFNLIKKHICRTKVDSDSIPSFPYHTEVPRVALFGLIGFVCSILAPLILPFLLVYFSLGYIVYKNQVISSWWHLCKSMLVETFIVGYFHFADYECLLFQVWNVGSDVAYCAQHCNIFSGPCSNNSPGCIWYKGFTCCFGVHHTTCDHNSTFQCLLQTAILSNIQECFCSG